MSLSPNTKDKIAGTLSGFDRLVFRGHLRSVGIPQGMMSYLWTNQVFLKNFGDHVEKVTECGRAMPSSRPWPPAVSFGQCVQPMR